MNDGVHACRKLTIPPEMNDGVYLTTNSFKQPPRCPSNVVALFGVKVDAAVGSVRERQRHIVGSSAYPICTSDVMSISRN
jgi:hypothetical protein